MNNRFKPSALILTCLALVVPLEAAFVGLARPAHASFRGQNRGFAFTLSTKFSGVPADNLATVSKDGLHHRGVGCGYGCHSGSPDWSPNGQRIAYVDDCGEECGESIAIRSAHLSQFRRLFSPKGFTGLWSPAWSPNGRRIAFIKFQTRHGGNIFVIRRDGTHLKRIQTPKLAEYELDWSSRNRLAVAAHVRGENELFIMRPDGSHRRRITHNHVKEGQLDWAPGGRRLTFVVGKGSYPPPDGREVWKIDASGKNASFVATGTSPTWAPAGSVIAFVVGDREIHTIRPSGKDDTLWGRPVYHGQVVSGLDWRPEPD